MEKSYDFVKKRFSARGAGEPRLQYFPREFEAHHSDDRNPGNLEGNGLEADSKFENYRILNPTGAFDIP